MFGARMGWDGGGGSLVLMNDSRGVGVRWGEREQEREREREREKERN